MSKFKPFERTRLHLAMAAWLALLTIGCGGATTSFEQVWHAQPADMGNVRRVVTFYQAQDGAMRRTVEDQMARKLLQQGVQAIPSYAVLDASLLNTDDRDKARTALAAKGFDAVLQIRLVSVESYPGQVSDSYWNTTYDWYWGVGWPTNYDDYVFESPIVRVETNLYSLKNDQLVWSGRSKTVEADSTNEVIDEVTSLVATTLQTRGVAVATARR
jgi:hypothetical protein